MFSFSFVNEFSVKSEATLLAVAAAAAGALGVEDELLLLLIIGEFVSSDKLLPMSIE